METRSTEDELLALGSLLASPSSKPARAGQAISPQRFPRVDEVTFQGGEPGGVMRRQAPRTAATTTTTMPAKYWPAERGALADEVNDDYEGRSEYHASACRAGATPTLLSPAHHRGVPFGVLATPILRALLAFDRPSTPRRANGITCAGKGCV